MPRKKFKQDMIDRMKQYFLQNDRMWKIMVIAISTLRSIVLWNILNLFS